jgi:hypothetical protein
VGVASLSSWVYHYVRSFWKNGFAIFFNGKKIEKRKDKVKNESKRKIKERRETQRKRGERLRQRNTE